MLFVGRIALPAAQRIILLLFDIGKREYAHAYQRHREELQAGHRFLQNEKAQKGRYRARGIADGRGNGKLNVPQARITQDHGQDIHSRGGQIGDDIRNAERRARGDEKEGVRAHYNAHSHDHLPMAVFIVGPGAQLGEQVRTAPEQNRNQGKNKPCHM